MQMAAIFSRLPKKRIPKQRDLLSLAALALALNEGNWREKPGSSRSCMEA
jgi:hypothetical protein